MTPLMNVLFGFTAGSSDSIVPSAAECMHPMKKEKKEKKSRDTKVVSCTGIDIQSLGQR